MGWYLDGLVSAVLGTHTHVATADEQVFPGGTAFQCDVGMTGPHESILGRRIDRVLETTDTIYPGHDIPFRVLKAGGVDYLVPKQLTLTGITPEEPGVTLDPTPRPSFVMPGISGQTLERLD